MEDSMINKLNEDIEDIFRFNIDTTKAYAVPSRDDPGLTFPKGENKKGKILETCVLFIDIRNSTNISRRLHDNKILLGKIYSAFIHSMTTIADEYGYVRNIVGDRVMVVFEPGSCFENAIKCAALMYTVAREIIAPLCTPIIFKVGIGIDFGEMLVLKAGIRKKHEELSEYKNLVWIGDAANIASKLTDIAGKELSKNLYRLECYPSLHTPLRNDPLSIFDNILKKDRIDSGYLDSLFKDTLIELVDPNELYQNLVINDEGILFKNKKVKSINTDTQKIFTSPVLISGKVYNSFRKIHSKSSLLGRFSKKEYNQVSTGSGIFGGGFVLREIISNL